MIFYFLASAVLVNLLLGGFVLLKNYRSKTHRSFALFIFTLSTWIAVNALLQYYQTLIFGRFVFGFSVLCLAALIYFESHYPLQVKQLSKPKRILILSGLFLFLISVSTDLVVEQAVIKNGNVGAIYGPFYPILLIYIILSFLNFSINLVRKYQKVDILKKAQINFLFLGLAILLISVMVTNVLLPLAGNYDFNKLGPVFSIFFTVLTGYAIVKYRLMDIRLLITRSLIYAVLTSVVLATFTIVTYVGTEYIVANSYFQRFGFLTLSSLILVLLLDPLKLALGNITNGIFYKGSINYNAATKKLSKIINDEIEIDKLISRFTKQVQSLLKIKRVAVLMPVGNQTFYAFNPSELNDKEPKSITLNAQSSIYQHALSHVDEIIILDELDKKVLDAKTQAMQKRFDLMRGELEQMNGYAIMPVPSARESNKISAFVLLTRKQSGEGFSLQDIQLLEVVIPQMASAIQKALLFAEVQEFNVKLQREVARATKELKLANEHLKELDTAKSEFMSIASHQLRTPLAGVMGYLSMLLGGDYGKINPKQEEVLKDILSAGQRLTRLVNAFLNATRIEAGRLSINYTKVSFGEIIESMYKELVPTADKKHVKLEFIKNDLPEVEVDVDKIKDVVLNLIDNAIKYSPGASVTVWGEKVSNKTVRFVCKDTGVGIPKEQAKVLFTKFMRGSGIAQVEPNGSGLGLFIARKIIEAHGGKIWAESEGEGKGSTFQFEIPIKGARLDPKVINARPGDRAALRKPQKPKRTSRTSATKKSPQKIGDFAAAHADTPTSLRKEEAEEILKKHQKAKRRKVRKKTASAVKKTAVATSKKRTNKKSS